MTTRPLIAVPAYPVKPGRVEGWEKPGVAVPTPYVEALQRAGALEAMLMPVAIDDADAADVLERFDGLLLMGGGDLDPEEYGQERRDEIYGVIPHRDRFELALVRAALDRGSRRWRSVAGTRCSTSRSGGSLDQHITDRDGVLAHGKPGVPGGSTVHDIEIEPGSRLATRWASRTRRARRTTTRPSSAWATACGSPPAAPDGMIEGIELDGDAWIVGAQWHPEDTAADDPAQQGLFDAFVASGGRDHAVDRRRRVALAGQRADEVLGAVELGDPPGEVGERVPARRQQVERGAVRGRVDAERAEDAELLVDDEVGPERPAPDAAGAGQHDRAAGAGERDGLRERGRRLGRDVDDDVGQRRPWPRAAPRPGRCRRRRRRGRRRRRRPARAARRRAARAGDHHEAGAGLLRRRGRRQPADARAEHGDHVAWLRCRAR